VIADHSTKDIDALKQIAELLNSSNEMDRMLDDALEKLLEVAGFTFGWILLVDDRQGSDCCASRNLPPALTAGEYSLLRGVDCYCVESYRNRKLQRAVNVIECRRIEYALKHRVGDPEGLTHHATVPLKSGDERFGLLNVAQAGKAHFDERELALLEAVALQIGTAMKRIRLYQSQEKNARLYARLGDAIQRIHAIPGPKQLPRQAVRIIGETFGLPNVSLFFSKNDELSLRAQYRNNKANEECQELALEDTGIVETAYRDNRLVVVSHGGAACTERMSSLGYPPSGSAAAIPLRMQGQDAPFGVLLFSSPSNKEFEDYQEDFLYSLGDHFTLSMANMRLAEQRREIARLEERNRMARDLHDSVMQKVFSLSFLAKGAESMLRGEPPAAADSLKEIGSLSQDVLREMRSLIWQLRPPGLENGVLHALEEYGRTIGLRVYGKAEGVKELPRAVEEAMWRIGQEALNNVKKHAGTNAAYVKLKIAESEAELEIEDRGLGFPKRARKKGRKSMGMTSMRERAEALGGNIVISSGGGMPSSVRAVFPIRAIEPWQEKEQDICEEN